MSKPKKLPVALLGASGMVGGMYQQLLSNHPYFELTVMPTTKSLDDERVLKEIAEKVPLVFSALKGTDKAAYVEMELAKRGTFIISNGASLRKNPLVPLLVPEINQEHLQVLAWQRKHYGMQKGGGIITKPNCTLASFILPLTPLDRAFQLKQISIVSMQATSGMGKDFKLEGNILPFIAGEEEKVETEPCKIWGSLGKSGFKKRSGVKIIAQCNRVPVFVGHQVSVHAQFEKPLKLEEVKQLWQEFAPFKGYEQLTMAPFQLLRYFDEPLRPQPALDSNYEKGMGISIGRARLIDSHSLQFVALSNNLIRGAAGTGILAAELAYEKGYISWSNEALHLTS